MKLVLKLFFALLGLLLLALVALLLLVDPNSFKPKIESLAQDQQIALQMRGDLSWRFWPRLGFGVENVAIAPLLTPETPIAQFKQASLGLAIKPLFSGEIMVDQVLLDGARIYLEVDENGSGNWESLGGGSVDTSEELPEANADAQSSALKLEVERILISDAALEFRDRIAGSKVDLRDLRLELDQVNTLGKPFTLALSWVFEMTQAASKKIAVSGSIESQIDIAKDFSAVNMNAGNLRLQFPDTNNAQIAGDFSAALSGLKDKLQYQTQMDLDITSVRNILAAMEVVIDTASPSVLGAASLNASIKGDASSVQVDPLALSFDQTKLSGSFAVKDFSTQEIVLVLNGNNINLDEYLPPASEETQAEVAESEDTPLPLDTMRSLKLDAKITMDALSVKKAPVKNIKLELTAKDGLIKENLSAQAYEGNIQLASTLRVGPQVPAGSVNTGTAALDFEGAVTRFQIAPLLNDLALNDNLQMSGAINADAKGSSTGATVNQILEQLQAKLEFSGAQMRLSPLNIEEKFCKAVNLVTQKTQTVDWADFTELKQFSGSVVWQDNIIELEKFKAGVSQLLLASTGRINLKTDNYEFKLPIKLTSPESAETYRGCTLSTKNYWVDRGLSLLRCRGSISNLQPLKDCGLDSDGLKNLTKNFAEYKLREKHGDKIDAAEKKLDEKKQELKDKKQELKSEAREDVEEKKTEVQEKIEEKKDELFNKLKKKLNKAEDKDGK